MRERLTYVNKSCKGEASFTPSIVSSPCRLYKKREGQKIFRFCKREKEL